MREFEAQQVLDAEILLSDDNDGLVLTEKQVEARKKRNIAIGLSLLAFVVLVFVVTVVRLGGNVLDRPL